MTILFFGIRSDGSVGEILVVLHSGPGFGSTKARYGQFREWCLWFSSATVPDTRQRGCWPGTFMPLFGGDLHSVFPDLAVERGRLRPDR